MVLTARPIRSRFQPAGREWGHPTGSPTPSGDLLAPAEIHALSPRMEAQVAGSA